MGSDRRHWQEFCRERGLILHRLQINEVFQKTSKELILSLREILNHGMTNAIDHGFEKQATDNLVEFEISLVEDSDGNIVLSLLDNGNGLDIEKIMAKAKERNISGDYSTVLFEKGFSTALSVSQSSGRGVGLTAIRDIVEAMKGQVKLENREDGKGCQLRIVFPKGSFYSLDSVS